MAMESSVNPAQISFTVSSSDVILQKHVKPLSDAVEALITNWDPDQGSLQLQKGSALLTLKVGDVLVGANYRIPPFKIASIT